MRRVGRWLDKGRAAANASTQSLDALSEAQNLESSMRAVELIMDDDIEGAERGLAHGNSTFHKLCKGTLGFMRAALGFEPEVMKEASVQLYDAESSASTYLYKARNDDRSSYSNIYDKGSEFALCQAQAQLMNALVALLSENLTESLKAFYKIRKAYLTLDGLAQMETNFLKATAVKSLTNSRQQSSESLASTGSNRVGMGGGPLSSAGSAVQQGVVPNRPSSLRQTQAIDSTQQDDSDDADEFYDADETTDRKLITQGYQGHVALADKTANLEKQVSNLAIQDRQILRPPPLSRRTTTATGIEIFTEDADSEVFTTSLDIFVHSGTNLCYGMFSLMISMIPPAFGKLMSVIGFKGDRERGIHMLWQASKFHNINGGMAGLVLFVWYNGLVGFCDIIPDSDPAKMDDIEGFPQKRLDALLVEMRGRYPKSYLWLVEEARMHSSRRQTDEALEILSRPGKSQLKQLEALAMFEKSLNCMNSHNYTLCAESFVACVDLNSWSQALYYYIAASCHVAIYRNIQGVPGKETEASKHETLADEFFKTAVTKVGKKKMMGRQLPFDTFVMRKITKWEERAKRFDCSFIDAIGVSPFEEMIYLWNGYKKMNTSQLEDSLTNLAWSENRSTWQVEEIDEKAILSLLRSVIFRNLRQHTKARQILRDQIICHDRLLFKGPTKDDWVAPVAHYEMAVNLWMERSGFIRQHGAGLTGTKRDDEVAPPEDLVGDAAIVGEAKGYIEKAKAWEKYQLDARFGIKVTAAFDAIKKWETKHGAT